MNKSEAKIEATKQIVNAWVMNNGKCFDINPSQTLLFKAFERLETEGICTLQPTIKSNVYTVTPST